MSDVSMLVGGALYGGWKSVRITRTIESIARTFAMDVSDRWEGQQSRWPIYEEDACEIRIDDETVICGNVSKRNPSFGATTKKFSYTGKSKAAALVQCSVVLEKWSFRNALVIDIVRKIAGQFGIKVSAQKGLAQLKAPPKVVVNPGDTGFSVISRVAKSVGVMVVDDGLGGILITRSGTSRATTGLVEGANLISGNANFDMESRYSQYIVMGQSASGTAKATAIDEDVVRTDRTLIIRATTGMDAEAARARADWEARIRAARADSVQVKVAGWKMDDGKLWPLNSLVHVQSPTLGIDGDMLISQADHMKGQGETTTIRLVRPDAFLPEPSAVVKKGKRKSGQWKELANGAK